MESKEVISAIGILVVCLILLLAAYLFSYIIDKHIYKGYTTNKNTREYKAIIIKNKQMFWRIKKGNDEIFVLAFVLELITIVLLLGTITAFIMTLILQNVWIIFWTTAVLFLYLLIILAIQIIIAIQNQQKL